MNCDLHTHSVFSDGTWTPEELVAEAERQGLSAIALTDHNTVAGLPRFLKAARGKSVEAVPGVEFSTDYLELDLHIVALDVPESAYDRITALMAESNRAKEESNLDLCAGLARIGYPLDYPAIRDATPNQQVNRAHIARAMVDLGYFPNKDVAFATVLDPGYGLYHPPKRPGSFEMIRFIRSVGAIPVMAHPFLKLSESGVRDFLRQAVPAGLIGMECDYVSFSPEQRALAHSLCREFGILPSGGSDFHGSNKPGISIGTGRGDLAVPARYLTALRSRR